MATDIILRSVKAAALTHAEMDQNWESLAQTVDAITADYTILFTDQNKIIECSIASGTITLPTVASAAGTDTDSFRVTIKNVNSTSLTVSGNGVDTIEGAGSVTLLENEAAVFALESAALEWNIIAFYGPNLAGITASPTELNYSVGVTSGIQGQLNTLNSGKQPLDAGLTDIAGLPVTNSNFIVGNGANWVNESGATARASMGVDASGTDNSTNVSLAGSPNYLSIVGQVITRALIDLASHVTGILPYSRLNLTNSIVPGDIAALAIQRSKLESYTAGTYTDAIDSGSTTNTSNVKLAEILSARGGTITVRLAVGTDYYGITAYGRIYKNGVAVGIQRSSTTTGSDFWDENFSINAGDLIQGYGRATPGAASQIAIQLGHSALTAHNDTLVF